jgi:hypothetical protein
MAETAFDEVYENGVLVSRVARVVSDAEIQRRDAPLKLRQSYTALRQWQQDAITTVAEWDTLTQAQKNTRLKIVIERFGLLSDRLADLLLAQSLD